MPIRHTSRIASLGVAVSLGLCAACSTGRSAESETAQPAHAPIRATAVETITAEEIDEQRVVRIEELLQTHASGVRVINRGNGNLSIRIRGVSSVMGSNEPLIVLDGVPMSQGSASSMLRGLNPRDVARVEVLKDAGATAIYGSRGANGVIVITTKRYR